MPLITLGRTAVTKEPDFRGSVYANIYPVQDPRGGTIEIARRLKQDKTAQFMNAKTKRGYGPDQMVRSKGFNTSKRNMTADKTVYEIISIPLPTWVKVQYKISIRTEYQQQTNELMRPFFTIAGNSRMPSRIFNEGHYYEVFIDGGFANGSNMEDMGTNQRNFETDITLEVLGYLIGAGENQENPKIIKRENAVKVVMGPEQSIIDPTP